MIDGLLISIIVGVISFGGSCAFALGKIKKNKPEFLRLAKISNDGGTTYDWGLIGNVIFVSMAFASGSFLLANVVLFLFTGIWSIPAESIGVLAIVFGIYMFKEFDRFVTSTIK